MFQLYIAAFDSEKMTGMPVHYQEWQASVGNLNDVVRFLSCPRTSTSGNDSRFAFS